MAKTIWLEDDEYKRLKELKEKAEERIGGKFDWGAFLLGAVAGGILTAILQDIVKEEKNKKGGEK